jgi:hypothetical protein
MDLFSFFLIVTHVLSVNVQGSDLSLDLDSVNPRRIRPKLTASSPVAAGTSSSRPPSPRTLALIRPPTGAVDQVGTISRHPTSLSSELSGGSSKVTFPSTVKKISKESDLLDSKKIDLPSVKHDSLLHPPISEKTSASIPAVKASGLSVEKMAPPAPEPATVYDKIYAVPLTGKNGSHEDLTFKTSPNVFNDREAPTVEKSDRLLDGKKSSSSAEHDAATGASTYPCVELAPRFDYISKTPVLSYLDFQVIKN